MEKVLEVHQLTKRFKHTTAVNNISFSVEKGNVYGLLGPNGSGKSTTFGMLLTTINPTSGSWKWFGEAGTSTDTLKKIGAIIEQPNFYPYLSAEKNLKIVAEIKQISYHRIDEVLDLVGLKERKKNKFSTYSLGMKQRLAIASALLNEPEVLILDEPTNGLDPEGIIQIRNLIVSIAKRGITIIIASHLLDEIERICSHVIVLKQGNAIYSGRVDEMTRNQAYFELESHQMDELLSALQSLSYFDEVKKDENRVIATIAHPIAPAELNKLLVEKGIYLSHLVLKKQSLENRFIELVKNQ